MDSSRFDALARRLGGRISRRDAVKGMVAGAAAVAVGSAVLVDDADARCGKGGTRCNRNQACCSGTCVWETVTRGRRKYNVGTCCRELGSACSTDAGCCSGLCYAGQCISACREVSVNNILAHCDSDVDCCNGVCGDDGLCKEPIGHACTQDWHCDNSICSGGYCSTCHIAGDGCSSNEDCCSGSCYNGACTLD